MIAAAKNSLTKWNEVNTHNNISKQTSEIFPYNNKARKFIFGPIHVTTFILLRFTDKNLLNIQNFRFSSKALTRIETNKIPRDML